MKAVIDPISGCQDGKHFVHLKAMRKKIPMFMISKFDNISILYISFNKH